MAVTTGTMMAISTGLSVVGQLQQGQAQQQASAEQGARLDEQARIDAIQAQRETVAAAEEAKRIRKAGDKQAAASRAQLAASGIAVGSGSAININEDIIGGSESDAMNTLLTGERRSESYSYSSGQNTRSAASARRAGDNAMTSSLLAAGSTSLKGWRGVGGGGSDPVGDFYQRGTRGSGD
jgi:hypothetical protein